MSKNLTRKGLALGTALAFVVTGLTATAPAYAAAGDVVSIAPTTGTGYGAYNTDYLSVTAKADTDVVTTAALAKLSTKIENAGQRALNIKLGLVFEGAAGKCTAPGFNYVVVDANGVAGTPVPVAEDATVAVVNASASVCAATSTSAESLSAATFTDTGSSVVIYGANTTIAGNLSSIAVRINAVDDATKNETATVKVTSWIDTDTNRVTDSTDKFPSTTETLTFYDAALVTVTPRIERFVGAAGIGSGTHFNAAGDAKLGVSLAFSPALNLDQVATGSNKFAYKVADNSTTPLVATSFAAELLAGSSQTHSAAGRIYGTVSAAGADTITTLVKSKAYTFTVTRTDGAAYTAATNDDAADYSTAGYTVPVQATDGVKAVTGVVVDKLGTDSLQASTTPSNVATAPKLRPGVKTFSYTATGTPNTPGTSNVANIPVIAAVTAVTVATGGSFTVGSTKLTKDQVALVAGVTDADGKFSVSVTSALAKATESYKVEFFILRGDSGNEGKYVSSTAYTALYQAAAISTFTAASKILSGSTVSAKYTVKDQFGKGIAANAAGTAYVVKAVSSDSTKVKQYVTVAADGTATVSFSNYLAKGATDSLSATVGTGTTDTTWAGLTTPAAVVATTFNPEDAAAINVVPTLTNKPITYDAFIVGAADAVTNVAPAEADAIVYTGTVVDTTGVGIPGAVVTVKGSGLQFRQASEGLTSKGTGDYAKDSITVSADTAGTFHVLVWAHKVSSTGISITTTAGAKSATTKLTTIANGLTGGTANVITADDLVFTWNAPAHPGVDTTYIVTGKVTDKWGNGINAASVVISADGALEVNGQPTVTRTTSASGVFRVYFRSLPKTDGVANISATLGNVTVAGTALTATEYAAAKTFSNVLTSDVNVGVDAAAVAGSKAGTAKVTAYNLKGKTATVYVAGKKVATIKSSAASKSVTVKAKSGAVVKVVVGSTTYFNEAVN